MRKTTSWIAGITVIAVVLTTIVFLDRPARADTAAAEATYKAKCAMCHAPDGKGETTTVKMTKVKDFSSEEVQKCLVDSASSRIFPSPRKNLPASNRMGEVDSHAK